VQLEDDSIDDNDDDEKRGYSCHYAEAAEGNDKERGGGEEEEGGGRGEWGEEEQEEENENVPPIADGKLFLARSPRVGDVFSSRTHRNDAMDIELASKPAPKYDIYCTSKIVVDDVDDDEMDW
jgi:hypothetical protein